MEIEQLRLFIAVWHAGSFAAAAQTRGVAASSVSRSIAALEDRLGARLFQRTTRAMRPTASGERFLPVAQGLVEDWDAARQALSGEDEEPTGILRVACSNAFADAVIAPELAVFTSTYPKVSVDLVVSDERINLIEQRIDIAVRHGALDDSTMVARKLASMRYRLVASPSFLKVNGPIETPDALSRIPIATFSFGEFQREWVLTRRHETRRTPITPTIFASSALALRRVAIAGAGVAQLADWMIGEALRDGSLVNVLPNWDLSGPPGAGDLWLVYPSRRFVPKKTRLFASQIEARTRAILDPAGLKAADLST